MRHAVFVYGSLLFEDIFEAVTGASAPRVDAVLAGHARYRLRCIRCATRLGAAAARAAEPGSRG